MKKLTPPELKWIKETPFNESYQDFYFSKEDGYKESNWVYVNANRLTSVFKKNEITVLGELGFGSALNFFSTLDCWNNVRRGQQVLWYVSVEKSPWGKEDQKKVLGKWDYLYQKYEWVIEKMPQPYEGFYLIWLEPYRCYLLLIYGEAENQLAQLSAQIDVWFLDGFSPSKNPELWNDAIFKQLKRLSHSKTTFSSFSCAGFVKRGLLNIGASIEKKAGILGKKEILTGCMSSELPKRAIKAPGHINVLGAGVAGCCISNVLNRRNIDHCLVDKMGRVASKTSSNPKALFHPKTTLKNGPVSQLTWQGYNYTKQWVLENLSSNHYDFSGVYTNEWMIKEGIHDTFYDGGWICIPEWCKTLVGNQLVHQKIKDKGVVIRCLGSDEEQKGLVLVRGSSMFIKTKAPFVESKALIGKGYVIPENEQTVMIGSTYDHKWRSPLQKQHQLINMAKKNNVFIQNPEIKNLWSGIRVTRKQKLPCCYEAQPGEWVLNALGSISTTSGLILAEHLVSKLTGEPQPLPQIIDRQIKT